MSLNNKIKQSGFTIVELLIVIVVIGILAAITIVAFNGIQNRANATASEALATDLIKKAEAYNAVKGVYPTSVELQAVTTDPAEAKLEGKLAAAIQGATTTTAAVAPTSTNGKTTVSYETCGTTPNFTGVRIGWWNYAAATPAVVIKNAGTTC